ncbi:malate synthase G [Microbacterium sp. 2FI]|uniref:malate synthase G n=1 Tax=Microbacterium sp. 2FI TaxID=2502193 RepID=UPI0010F4EE0C|nr:malate synthase G [Microbacterium sp. 2FI]
MNDRRVRADLSVDPRLDDFVAGRLASAAHVEPHRLWETLAAVVTEFTPRIRAALDRRDQLQRQLDDWHSEHPGAVGNDYVAMLAEIGYLEPEPEPFTISTDGVDDEIAVQAGPQLVVPLTNARFAANAANARWGSLYDALYGTDAIPRTGDLAPSDAYNPRRGAEVVRWSKGLLDDAVPLADTSHAQVLAYEIDSGGLLALTADGAHRLVQPSQLVGYRGDSTRPDAVILVNHGLHLEITIDRSGPVGTVDPAGVSDVILESAITTIMDLEDSVAVVDAADKVNAYETWLALMQGTLEVDVVKSGRTFTRRLAADRTYKRVDGTAASLSGRSLLFVRHTGHAMFTDAVIDGDGEPIPEGILDAVITVAAALPDARGEAHPRNSAHGSIYVVKPKMHGPDEVALTAELFARLEELLHLPTCTIKLGIMDEERRTTLNLGACIRAAADRVVFINTGFLDRTGDEIHTSSRAGSFPRKAALRTHPFIGAYENHNVDVGLRAGLPGRAQIGKGMWAMTDLMAAMLAQKGAQLQAGASTAWVPSPTAATLHATHYHRVDVRAQQRVIAGRPPTPRLALLDIPLATASLSADEVAAELDDNVQSILGYVVRWVDQGIGCSKVPDLSDVSLMEDRATLRISSQLLGNWLTNALITPAQVIASLDRIAPRVDAQNASDATYRSLGTSASPSLAFQAARDLVLFASAQQNGYTEGILHDYRRRAKEQS